MAISYITGGIASSATFSFSGYSAGDYLICILENTSNATTPTLPSGWSTIASASDSTDGFAMSVIGKFATGSDGFTGTNVTAGNYIALRGVNTTTPFSNAGGQAGSGTTISYSGIGTMTQAGGAGTSWALYAAAANGSSSQLYNAVPTGATEESLASNYYAGPPAYAVEFFAKGPTSSASFNNQTLAATAAWITKTFEINAAPAGGGTPTNLFFFG